MDNYQLTLPTTKAIPVVLSIPHCGTAFPDDIRDQFSPELIASPDDTDWFLDRLYDFAPALGITTISAVWSRWVIDLNRHPQSKPLYTDGRIITGLCPVTTFLGQPLYRDRRSVVNETEVMRRRKLYFQPYHEKLGELIAGLRSQFGTVLLWDCHSIRQQVSTIRAQKFPDLILGSAGESSAHPLIIQSALRNLNQGIFAVKHNDPFKGGYITRNYGRPALHQHALQLEMCKVNYMDDTETLYHRVRAKKMAELLYNTLSSIAEILISIKD